MLRRIFFTLVCATFLLSGHSAKAEEETTFLSEVGWWTVGVDWTLGGGCFMQAFYDPSTFLRVTFSPNQDKALFIIGDKRWKSLEANKEYPIDVQFGRKAPWTVDAVGISFPETYKSLNFSFNAEFVDELMRQVDVRVSYDGKVISHLRLDGSYRAFAKVLECQNQIEQIRTEDADPFGATGPSGSDPFS